MDSLLPIIIVIFTIISIVNTAKKKKQQDDEKSKDPASNRRPVNPDMAQFFGFKDTLNFFEQQFAEIKKEEAPLSEGILPIVNETETFSLENQDIAFSTPLIRDADSTCETKSDMNVQSESSSPVLVYDLETSKEHDYEAPIEQTARNAALVNLFSNKNEITRAVIYSEVLKPKFKRI